MQSNIIVRRLNSNGTITPEKIKDIEELLSEILFNIWLKKRMKESENGQLLEAA